MVDWMQLLNNIAATKPGLWGIPAWYMALAIGYGLGAATLLWLLRRAQVPRNLKLIGVVLISLAALRGWLYVGLDYPWQTPDEHGHFEYVALTARLGRVPTLADIDANLQREILQSMYAYRWWTLGYNQPMPTELPRSIADDPILVFSWVQVGDEPFLYYALLSPVYQLTSGEPVIVQLYALRSVSSWLLPLTVLLTFLCLSEVFNNNLLLVTAGTAFMTFHSMLAYVASGVNNDVFGTLTGVVALWMVYRIFKYGLNWRRTSLIAAVIVITVLSNKPNLFFVPWIVLILMSFAFRPICRWLRYHWRTAALGLATIVAVLSVLALLPDQDAADWVQNPWPGAPTHTEVDGQAALYIRDDSAGSVRPLIQDAAAPLALLASQTLRLTVDVRSESAERQPVRVQYFDGVQQTVVTTTVGREWQTVMLTHTISAGAWRAKVLIAADSGISSDRGAVFARNVQLNRLGTIENFVSNSSGATTGRLLTRLVNTVVMPFGINPELFTFFRNPHLFDAGAQAWYAQGFQTLFEWFWGRFAYIAVPLQPGLYQTLLILSLVGGLGLIVQAARNWLTTRLIWGTQPAWRRNALICWGLAFALNLLEITFPMLRESRTWLPQGRYLFPVLLPIGVMLSAGWLAWFPARVQKWGVALVILGFITLDVAVIAIYIIPHYYLAFTG